MAVLNGKYKSKNDKTIGDVNPIVAITNNARGHLSKSTAAEGTVKKTADAIEKKQKQNYSKEGGDTWLPIRKIFCGH